MTQELGDGSCPDTVTSGIRRTQYSFWGAEKELKHKIKLQEQLKNIKESRPYIGLHVWLDRRVSEVFSERPDHEKNQMDCWRKAWNILKYRKNEKKIVTKLGMDKVPLMFSLVM